MNSLFLSWIYSTSVFSPPIFIAYLPLSRLSLPLNLVFKSRSVFSSCKIHASNHFSITIVVTIHVPYLYSYSDSIHPSTFSIKVCLPITFPHTSFRTQHNVLRWFSLGWPVYIRSLHCVCVCVWRKDWERKSFVGFWPFSRASTFRRNLKL
jgi:hypothetical protein